MCVYYTQNHHKLCIPIRLRIISLVYHTLAIKICPALHTIILRVSLAYVNHTKSMLTVMILSLCVCVSTVKKNTMLISLLFHTMHPYTAFAQK